MTAGGPFSGIGAFDLNDAGAVAFRATLTAGGNGLFTGPDLDADRVVRSGEALSGAAVTGLNVRTGGIELVNDAQLNGGPLVNTGPLRGDGTVGNAVTNAGSLVVTFDNHVFLGSGLNTQIEIAGLATGEFDQFIINGDLALDGTLTVVPLDGFAFGPNQSLTIFDVSGALSGTFAGLGEGDRVGAFGGTDLFITYAGGTGNDVALFTPVPEPSTAGLLALGAAGLLHRRRRATGSSAARATT